jgi:erythromycin esterase-like protein
MMHGIVLPAWRVVFCIYKIKAMKVSFLNKIPGQQEVNDVILQNSVELTAGNLDRLMDKIGDARFVLLGEASHGTHEYYTWRAKISKKLIEEKGFSFIAVEGDWPDCYRVNRYVKNYSDAGENALEVLHQFNRWPTWMWANWEVVAFSEWLKKHNSRLPRQKQTGFYGLDVYSLWESLDAIINYLDKVDKRAKETALQAFRCFEPYADGEGQAYAQANYYMSSSCETEVVNLLKEIIKKLPQYNTDHEAVLSTEQNAYIIAGAEKYYRAMMRPGADSWNIRDHHMVDTLNRLVDFHGKNAKAVIWEHNTHIGDARATSMAGEGMVNVGQLLNEQYGDKVFSIGFGSYKGSVIAGRYWGDDMRIVKMPDAATGSWENILHQLDGKNRIVFMEKEVEKIIGQHHYGHRAIGVVYNPEYEQMGNYVPSIMPMRYNAFIYIDQTQSLHPLHIETNKRQMPETYPFGL